MNISAYGSTQAVQFQPRSEVVAKGTGNFESQLQDRVSISDAGATASSSVLSASEKSFFNNAFGMKVFASESSSSSVIGSQAATVLSSQEINFFENSFAVNRNSYGRNGGYAAQSETVGMSLNRSV